MLSFVMRCLIFLLFHIQIHPSLGSGYYAFFSNSFTRFNPARAFATPSVNPIFFARAAASSYCLRASAVLPSISKNSPRLWVATAQPMSHSSVRSGDFIWLACCRARSAHWRACSMRRARGAVFETGKSEGRGDMVIASVEEGGVCWTRQVEMLFTGWISLG